MAQIVSFWITRALISLAGVLGLCAIYYFAIAARPPIHWLASSVYPDVVDAGGTIYVRRQYVLDRDITIEISRKLVSGNCTGSCTIYDLESSTSFNTVGTYDGTRAIRIPSHVKPGKYTLNFNIHWQNTLGYKYTDSHPVLNLEVR